MWPEGVCVCVCEYPGHAPRYISYVLNEKPVVLPLDPEMVPPEAVPLRKAPVGLEAVVNPPMGCGPEQTRGAVISP